MMSSYRTSAYCVGSVYEYVHRMSTTLFYFMDETTDRVPLFINGPLT